ncbi:alpha/beta hydrolase [Pseudactinotalea sp. HY158]|uniref:alpha/beta hydrolase n=1 Tax=Pseudactinotalea sp. HY158 TaxID=2654547 RepID=UPI00129C685E|nr:alpha/beta hydrolase [Pseudactinotalea sp. HY158]QGH68399.1 alpha/beta fold hydrolase [Pseudactinotalea sp. HY158]
MGDVFHPPLAADAWQDDHLGPGFHARALPAVGGRTLGTLVRHLPELDPDRGAGRSTGTAAHTGTDPRRPDRPRAPGYAVLYVHGWSDYFFNRELARFVARAGGAFYAVDLRHNGRSLRAGLLPAYIEDLRDYFDELDAALAHVRAEHPDLPVVVIAHSQGGLTASLWAAERLGPRSRVGSRPHRAIAALVLNAPWLDQAGAPGARRLATPAVTALAAALGERALPIPSPGFYGRTIWAEHGGEWAVDHDWQPDPGAPIRPAWLRAVLAGQARVASGLDLPIPVLVLTSNRTLLRPRWHEDMRRADIVIDVTRAWRRVRDLGTDTTLIKVRDAVHDVFLSPPAVRARAYDELGAWLAEHGFRAGTPSAPTGTHEHP